MFGRREVQSAVREITVWKTMRKMSDHGAVLYSASMLPVLVGAEDRILRRSTSPSIRWQIGWQLSESRWHSQSMCEPTVRSERRLYESFDNRSVEQVCDE